jgi:hypothetical protein
MHRRSGLICLLTAALLASAGLGQQQAGAKKEEKKRSGTIVGTLTEKGPNFIEVKAAGEEKARRYVPQWVGGNPNQGGGPDKKVLKLFEGLKVGDRVRLEWEFDERARVLHVEALKKSESK